MQVIFQDFSKVKSLCQLYFLKPFIYITYSVWSYGSSNKSLAIVAFDQLFLCSQKRVWWYEYEYKYEAHLGTCIKSLSSRVPFPSWDETVAGLPVWFRLGWFLFEVFSDKSTKVFGLWDSRRIRAVKLIDRQYENIWCACVWVRLYAQTQENAN